MFTEKVHLPVFVLTFPLFTILFWFRFYYKYAFASYRFVLVITQHSCVLIKCTILHSEAAMPPILKKSFWNEMKGFRSEQNFIKATFSTFLRYHMLECKCKVAWDSFNSSRTDPGRREKTNSNFYFHTSLWCLQRPQMALQLSEMHGVGKVKVLAWIKGLIPGSSWKAMNLPFIGTYTPRNCSYWNFVVAFCQKITDCVFSYTFIAL